uniref:CSON015404 protein n=1 Tax=Culicoides sonorensis TaxID=179676 RepID=A0A336LT63_CULSO
MSSVGSSAKLNNCIDLLVRVSTINLVASIRSRFSSAIRRTVSGFPIVASKTGSLKIEMAVKLFRSCGYFSRTFLKNSGRDALNIIFKHNATKNKFKISFPNSVSMQKLLIVIFSLTFGDAGCTIKCKISGFVIVLILKIILIENYFFPLYLDE